MARKRRGRKRLSLGSVLRVRDSDVFLRFEGVSPYLEDVEWFGVGTGVDGTCSGDTMHLWLSSPEVLEVCDVVSEEPPRLSGPLCSVVPPAEWAFGWEPWQVQWMDRYCVSLELPGACHDWPVALNQPMTLVAEWSAASRLALTAMTSPRQVSRLIPAIEVYFAEPIASDGVVVHFASRTGGLFSVSLEREQSILKC
jgi:hypothetical protein